METQVGTEVRRIHVIYFLSRKGSIEHPHLIRVHHLSRNGVHLRDVKRWLAELRGKEMPESFSWSYKRRYKNGYVWQDLLDEDLITPISDNEYVLKGSEISSNCSKDDSLSESPRKDEMSPQNQETSQMDVHKRSTSSQIEEESPSFSSEKSTLTDDSLKVEENVRIENHSFSCSTPNSTESNKKENKNDDIMEENISTPTTSASSRSSATFNRSKSCSNGASLLFRNLINCRNVETNDSAMVTVNKRNKLSATDILPPKKNHQCSSDITKGDKLGGSEWVFGTTLNQQPQYSSRKGVDGLKSSTKINSDQKPTPPYKPINGPQCSQCGKPFKPEKLHAHMKSCKGMKALAKGVSPVISSEKSSSEFPFVSNPVSGYYLTHTQ